MSKTKNISSLLKPLSADLVKQELLSINQGSNSRWIYEKTGEKAQISAEYTLKTFPRTWKFLSSIAREAHRVKHHPTLITTYNKVKVELCTHDANNNVTVKDLDLARSIQSLYKQLSTDTQKYSDAASFLESITEKTTLSKASKQIESLISAKKSK